MRDSLANLNFYLTPGHPCSYLPEQEARTVFVDPRADISGERYAALTEQGFRRSGAHVYRPHCGTCEACIPTRIPLAAFQPRRSQRRIARRNADLRVTVEPAHFDERIYELYERYLAARHDDGDMYPPTPEQFRSFLLPRWGEPLFLSLWHGDQRVGVAVTDRMPHALSAVYTFFDPSMSDRSLGVQAILAQIDYGSNNGLSFLYLGYWIRECRKMRYKIDYRPIELRVNGVWVRVH